MIADLKSGAGLSARIDHPRHQALAPIDDQVRSALIADLDDDR
ncbi:MAG: hypothetical protein WBW61_08490 [Rhodanobacteraceae bacterium]